VTFYKSLDQLPAFEDYSMAKRTYRYFTGEPLYPFGYGLSYTSFAYHNARVSNASVPADGSVNISVDVSNSGKVSGDEVVQLYLTHEGVAVAPQRALSGFRRIHLESGEQKTVTFQLNNQQLSLVDEAGNHRVVPGQVRVWIAGGQPVSRSGLPKPAGAETHFRIVGTATLPD
jgi:beta-glucosidase